MARPAVVLIGGIVLGALTMFFALQLGRPGGSSPDEVVRDISNVPVMAQATAEKHRNEQYVSLTSILELIALPTEFARSAALFSLADRSDSASVQRLIFEANRVADDLERARLLNVLFFRLAELDPQSALVLSRSDDFGGIKSIERTVWRAWARKDLDDALFEAKTQTSIAYQNSAAQSLYAAFGYMGNETTDYIEGELGIGPDRSSRGRYLYRLADESTPEAIAFINSLDRGVEQKEYVSWLAYYVSLGDPQAALAHAPLFDVAADGERFESIITSNIARENPRATIDRLLAGGNRGSGSSELYSALRALASSDLSALMDYYEQARSTEDKQMFGSTIAAELARSDPEKALAWADAHDAGRIPRLKISVIAIIAETDPQRAFMEAVKAPDVEVRSQLVSDIVHRIARSDPSAAVAFLDQIQDKRQRLDASRQLASTWIRRDPEAATDWILSQDQAAVGPMLQSASFQLVRHDVDKAIQLLPKMDPSDRVALRQQIAERLATNRSPSDAQAFVRQFEGQPGYDQLQASVIAGVAKSDVFSAKQLADQLSSGAARDRAYMEIIIQQAQTDPVQAIGWLNSVGSDHMRGAAAGQLVTRWYASDPSAAVNWVSNLPGGALKDDAIMHMSTRWERPTTEQEDLIATISDREKRGQAKVRQVYRLMRTDPTRARELLKDEDIPSSMRQQAEVLISQYGSRL